MHNEGLKERRNESKFLYWERKDRVMRVAESMTGKNEGRKEGGNEDASVV